MSTPPKAPTHASTDPLSKNDVLTLSESDLLFHAKIAENEKDREKMKLNMEEMREKKERDNLLEMDRRGRTYSVFNDELSMKYISSNPFFKSPREVMKTNEMYKEMSSATIHPLKTQKLFKQD